VITIYDWYQRRQ